MAPELLLGGRQDSCGHATTDTALLPCDSGAPAEGACARPCPSLLFVHMLADVLMPVCCGLARACVPTPAASFVHLQSRACFGVCLHTGLHLCAGRGYWAVLFPGYVHALVKVAAPQARALHALCYCAPVLMDSLFIELAHEYAASTGLTLGRRGAVHWRRCACACVLWFRQGCAVVGRASAHSPR